MKSTLRVLTLIGGMLFAAITLWSAYWAIALQREGGLVTVEIVAHGAQSRAPDGDPLIEVHEVWKYDGREDRSVSQAYASFAPKVGTRVRFYTVTSSIAFSSHQQLPADWWYAWTPPALSFMATCALLWTWRITRRPGSLLQGCLGGCAFLLASFLIYRADSFNTVVRIMDHVKYQRAGHDYERLNPRLAPFR